MDLRRKLRSLALIVLPSLLFLPLMSPPAAGLSEPTLLDVRLMGAFNTPKGYVELSSAPTDCCLTVELTSSHPRLLLYSPISIGPNCDGCSPATFKGFSGFIYGSETDTTVTVSATLNGVTVSTTVTIAASTPTLSGYILDPADTLHVPDDGAKYSNDRLEVRATSTDPTATLRVYTWRDNDLGKPYIGTMENKGNGRYEGKFYWPGLEKYEIYVISDRGGCFYKQVNRKYPGGAC